MAESSVTPPPPGSSLVALAASGMPTGRQLGGRGGGGIDSHWARLSAATRRSSGSDVGPLCVPGARGTPASAAPGSASPSILLRHLLPSS